VLSALTACTVFPTLNKLAAIAELIKIFFLKSPFLKTLFSFCNLFYPNTIKIIANSLSFYPFKLA